MKLRKGDPVRVITGKDKGKEGVVEHVYPKADKILVSGVNTAAKHQRAARANEQ
nr:50S ribosomal protein L24 [Ilumatobacter sp.]